MTDTPQPDPTVETSSVAPSSRRKFLGSLAAGVGAAVVLPSTVSAQSDERRGGRNRDGDRRRGNRDRGRDGNGNEAARFSRLFELPPFAEPSTELRQALAE